MKLDREKSRKFRMKKHYIPMPYSAYPIPTLIYDYGKPQAASLYYYKELPSTNRTAKELFFSQAANNRRFIVLADRQSAGRGRLGRSFFSEGGLYFTCAVPRGSFSLPPELITTAAAAAVCRAITGEGFPVRIKWVNDILLDGKKICGILAEALSERNSAIGYIVGIGINIGTSDFPEAIADTAASLPGDPLLKSRVFHRIIETFYKALNENPHKLLDYCTEKSFVIGKPLHYFGAADGFGTAIGLDSHGGLIVKKEDGTTVVLSGGEISIRPTNG